MTGMEHAIEQAARAEAERKSRDEHWCGDPDVFAAGAEWAVAHLREAGLLAPAPLREEWGVAESSDDLSLRWVGLDPSDEWLAREQAHGLASPLLHRFASDWLPVDRTEGDGRADCPCAHCHSRPYSIMHICPDCGSKRCARAAHHVNPCEAGR